MIYTQAFPEPVPPSSPPVQDPVPGYEPDPGAPDIELPPLSEPVPAV